MQKRTNPLPRRRPKTGVRVDFLLTDWQDALQVVRDGRADAIGSFRLTPGRKDDFDFTFRMHEIDTAIFFHEDIGGIRGVVDLVGFQVGCVRGHSATELLGTHNSHIQVVLYDNAAAMVADAAAGVHKVFVADTPVAHFYLAQNPGGGAFRESKPIDSNAQYVGVREGNDALLAFIQKGFSEVSSAEMARVRDAWVGKPVFSGALMRWVAGAL